MPRNADVEIAAAILAGGESKRMGGQDKGLVALASKPLIAHVCVALREQAGVILVCANRNHSEYSRYGEVVADAMPGFKGPLAGIAAALAQCKTAWLLTVPVDGPDLPNDLAARLLDGAVAANSKAAVVHDGIRRQPLFALYHGDLARDALRALERDLPPWRWQDEIGAREVDFSDQPQAFANLNTSDDFRVWENRHGI